MLWHLQGVPRRGEPGEVLRRRALWRLVLRQDRAPAAGQAAAAKGGDTCRLCLREVNVDFIPFFIHFPMCFLFFFFRFPYLCEWQSYPFFAELQAALRESNSHDC